ncbi:MAG TPA: hypothetical protein VLS94_08085, partial [Fusibacter sp.]|nr:hypothetical protein [Fusibacter sp.]
ISEDGRKLTLLDYYVMDARSLNKHELGLDNLEFVLKAIATMPESQIERVDFAFDMTGFQGLHQLTSRQEEKSGWMVRTLGAVHFPETFCYPKLA